MPWLCGSRGRRPQRRPVQSCVCAAGAGLAVGCHCGAGDGRVAAWGALRARLGPRRRQGSAFADRARPWLGRSCGRKPLGGALLPCSDVTAWAAGAATGRVAAGGCWERCARLVSAQARQRCAGGSAALAECAPCPGAPLVAVTREVSLSESGSCSDGLVGVAFSTHVRRACCRHGRDARRLGDGAGCAGGVSPQALAGSECWQCVMVDAAAVELAGCELSAGLSDGASAVAGERWLVAGWLRTGRNMSYTGLWQQPCRLAGCSAHV